MGAALDEAKVGRQFDTWLREQMKDDVPCQWPTCPTPAVWRMRMPCCGETRNTCTEHKAKWIANARQMTKPVCAACRAPLASVDDIVWTPI